MCGVRESTQCARCSVSRARQVCFLYNGRAAVRSTTWPRGAGTAWVRAHAARCRAARLRLPRLFTLDTVRTCWIRWCGSLPWAGLLQPFGSFRCVRRVEIGAVELGKQLLAPCSTPRRRVDKLREQVPLYLFAPCINRLGGAHLSLEQHGQPRNLRRVCSRNVVQLPRVCAQVEELFWIFLEAITSWLRLQTTSLLISTLT